MQLLEYKAKELLAEAGASVPHGLLVRTGELLDTLPFAYPAVVKSQVPVGGRGKLGGVKLVGNDSKLIAAQHTISQLEIKGHLPEGLLVEQALDIERELYLALRVNRDLRRVEYLVSLGGGVEVESASSVHVIPLHEDGARGRVLETLGLVGQGDENLLMSLEQCFYNNDLLLLEVNPLVVTTSGDTVCADAKIVVDDNARFRHPALPWTDEPSLRPLGGTIGVIANGAGMAMSTMDTIYAAGGRPANFLDIGGGTGEDVFVKNLRDITALPDVTSIIINIFAGITRCDDIARGIIAAKTQIPDLPPLFIRLEGTNRDEAVVLLEEAGVGIEPDLASCVALAITRAKDRKSERAEENHEDKNFEPRTMNLESEPTTSFSEGSAFPAERGKTSRQLAPSVPEEKGVVGERQKDTDEPSPASIIHNLSSVFSPLPTLVQGITGHHGAFHTKGMIDAGTNIVAGVTPGKGGETVHNIPVYNSVKEAVEKHRATASVVFVPARFAKSAVLEAIDAGIQLVVIITEGIPVHDMLAIRSAAAEHGVAVVGPNCPGLVVPGSHKLGIIAAHITSPGHTAVISRSGTLTYELADALSKKGIGQRLILGIGGDPVQGMNFVEALEIAQNDPGTSQIVLVGEIGGESEQMAADFVATRMTKPVYGLVVGHSLPAGQTFGHAGAIVGSRGESADEKTAYMATKGIRMSPTLDQLIVSINAV